MTACSVDRKSKHADHDKLSVQLLLRLWRGLLVAAILLSVPIHAYAQAPAIDTSAIISSPSTENTKLGARLALGGLYASMFREHPPIYGVRVAGLFPVGMQCDLTAAGEFLTYAGWSYTTYPPAASLSLNSTTTTEPWTTKVPNSQLGSVRIGVRLYARYKRSDALVAALSPRFKRPFWRKRVDRSGFNVGFYSGPVVGWHKRTIRTVPEDWPLNEPIPVSAVEQQVQPYTRWYWNTSFEFGWSFNGRVDLTVVLGLNQRFHGDPGRNLDEASNAYPLGMYTTSFSYILGRTNIKAP